MIKRFLILFITISYGTTAYSENFNSLLFSSKMVGKENLAIYKTALANKKQIKQLKIDIEANKKYLEVIRPKLISKNKNGGSIINISSDLGLIAPDQRIYEKKHLKNKDQAVKPITYSVAKAGIIGLTKYISTYWADKNVRCNVLCPGGVKTNQDKEFIKNLTSKLYEWTLSRWLITISKSEGLPSIKQKKNNIKNELLETAKKDFIYQNVMETFSDAELIDIKNDIEDNG